MKLSKKFFFLIGFIQINASAQSDYIWPTDAGHALTSSFAETRPGRFHAGIDIKTWGREGYEIYAIRPGHISKIAVSPFGYGRVIYLTLDTGEIVIYAHLQKFNRAVEEYVRAAQERVERFSVQLYPEANEFVVNQGDLLGFTGQTGVGYPHLHFEVRDSGNHPMNPFLKGYTIEDSIAPTITAVSLTPMDVHSMVNDDWKPAIFPVAASGNGRFGISGPIMVSGSIAFGVNAYDQMNLANNKFSTYTNELFVDDSLIFRSQYNRFSYDENNQSNLDRDYRLITRGAGTFYKLFRDVGNTLSFYGNKNFFYGIAHFPSPEQPSVNSLTELYQKDFPSMCVYECTPGVHQFKIVVKDYWGNSSHVNGVICSGSRAVVHLKQDEVNPLADPNFTIKSSTVLSECTVSISYDSGRTWQQVQTLSKAANASVQDESATQFNFQLSDLRSVPNIYLRASAKDDSGLNAHPAFLTVNTNQTWIGSADQPDFDVKADYYDRYVRLEFIKRSGLDLSAVSGWDTVRGMQMMALISKNPTTTVAVWPLTRNTVGPVPLELFINGQEGQQRIQREWLDFITILPGQTRRVMSDDDLCCIDFNENSLFDHIFLRTRIMNPESLQFPVISKIYFVEPVDVALKKSVSISIQYPAGDSLPEKLAVFTRSNGERWSFVGNRLKRADNVIAASTATLGSFCLMRDIVAPEILSLSPVQNAHLTASQPVLRARFKDELSGIEGEDDMALSLDGKKLIAEYDPDQKALFYNPRTPLSRGKHIVRCRINDRCGNETIRSHTFWIE